jgi:hypothetical protein
MWVIGVYNDISEYRNFRISELTGDNSNRQFLGLYSGNKKYSKCSIFQAKVFKNKNYADKIVEEFNSLNIETKRGYTNKFSWMSDCVLSVYKLKQEEWLQIIDFEISKLDNRYQKQKSRLLKKRQSYK